MNKENAIIALRRCNLDTPELRYVVDHIKCFTCLDTRQLWRDREGLPFSAWDGRGKYDIIKCNVCSSGHWDRCSTSQNIVVNNYRIFKKGNNDMSVRVREMEKEANEQYVKDDVKKLNTVESDTPKRRSVSLVDSMVKGILVKRIRGEEAERKNELIKKEEERKEQVKKEEERKEEERKEEERKEEEKKEEEMKEILPEWWLSKSRVIQRDATKVGVEVAVNEIAKDVYALIKGYSGDLLHIANWAKDFTISLSSTLEHCTSTNAHVEQFKDDKNGTTYLILKFEKTDSVKSYNYYVYTSKKEKTSILSKVFLFKPKNESAEIICDRKVNDIIMRNLTGLDDI